MVKDISQIREPSVDLAILKNEAFKSIQHDSIDSADFVDSDSEHRFKYSSIEQNMDRQSMEFQMRESMVKYNKNLPTMEKIVKLDKQFQQQDRKLCKSCLDRVQLPVIRKNS